MSIEIVTCPSCDGTGAGRVTTTAVPYGSTTATFDEVDPCEECDGTGRIAIEDPEAEEPLGVGEFE